MAFRVRRVYRHRPSGRLYVATLVGEGRSGAMVTTHFAEAAGPLPLKQLPAFRITSERRWPEPPLKEAVRRWMNARMEEFVELTVVSEPGEFDYDAEVYRPDLERLSRATVVDGGGRTLWQRITGDSAVRRCDTVRNEHTGRVYDVLYEPATKFWFSARHAEGVVDTEDVRGHSSQERAAYFSRHRRY